MIPKKRNYSDREVEEILQSLFQEKKKVHDLELKLENCTLSPTLPAVNEEISALKAEIATWKKRYEDGRTQQAPSSTKEAQLERVVAFLRNKADQAELEQKELLNKIAQLEAQSAVPAQNTDRLNELEEELTALQSQLDALRKMAKASEEQKMLLEKKTLEQQDVIGSITRELESQRQMVTGSLQEFKEERRKKEEQDHQRITALEAELAHERSLKSDGFHTLEEREKALEFIRAQLESKQKEADDTFKKLQEQLIAHQELIQFTEELKSKMQKAEDLRRHAQDALSQRDNQLESLNAQVANLARSLSDLEETAQQAMSERNEQESRLRVAQQHLAKKVRESTILAEKNEELRLKTADIEEALENAKNKQLELQTALDSEANHQKKLQEQYHETLKSHETQAARWEARYLEMHQRCQDLESRNRELRYLEERFNKMQQAISQLSAIVGSPHPLTIQESEIYTPPKEIADIQMAPPAAPCVTIQPSLFEAQASQPRFKESLFG
jgi:chromosome segregation ATPase